jgi:hypothetical protein
MLENSNHKKSRRCRTSRLGVIERLESRNLLSISAMNPTDTSLGLVVDGALSTERTDDSICQWPLDGDLCQYGRPEAEKSSPQPQPPPRGVTVTLSATGQGLKVTGPLDPQDAASQLPKFFPGDIGEQTPVEGIRGPTPFERGLMVKSNFTDLDVDKYFSQFGSDAATTDKDGGVVVHSFLQIHVHRFLPDGTPDSNFGIDGLVRLGAKSEVYLGAVGVAPDGRIIIVANRSFYHHQVVIALQPHGELDTTFGDRGVLTFSVGYFAARGISFGDQGEIRVHSFSMRGEPETFSRQPVFFPRFPGPGDLEIMDVRPATPGTRVGTDLSNAARSNARDTLRPLAQVTSDIRLDNVAALMANAQTASRSNDGNLLLDSSSLEGNEDNNRVSRELSVKQPPTAIIDAAWTSIARDFALIDLLLPE